MNAWTVLEVVVALVILWRALLVCNHMTRGTRAGIRYGWLLAGFGAAWWAGAVMAGDPVRFPLTVVGAGLALLALSERRGGGRWHGHA